MKPTFNLFRLKNTKVGVHWTFIILIIWILLVDSLNNRSAFHTLWALLAMTALFASVLLHELAHMIMARYYGIVTKSILLLPVGGVTHLKNQPSRPEQEIMVSVSGPLVNLLVALLLIPFIPGSFSFWHMLPMMGGVDGHNFIFFVHFVNLTLGLLNLIPAFPLDGGRVLRGILQIFTSPVKATLIAVWIGRGFAILLCLSGIFNLNLLLVVTGFILLLQGTAEIEYVMVRQALDGLTIKDVATNDFITISAAVRTGDTVAILGAYRQPYFVIIGEDRPVGIVDRKTLLRHITAQEKEMAVGELTLHDSSPLDGNQLAIKAWEELPAETERILPVMTGKQLTGVVCRENIIEYLILHNSHIITQQLFH
ncbi:site-2 protease family protein [Chitinophaga tropicalis]|uniref:Zinc metalloprotease n=1 Tax=Chitinophaga tropicalis TaxID=2683588 RepID=A0A7K1U2Z1_9BACT|nr:site-2 protease family protein [Chitinophaga tropicalis]MVT08723.1 hypothetical protein [Chitinophaga tropicalis]